MRKWIGAVCWLVLVVFSAGCSEKGASTTSADGSVSADVSGVDAQVGLAPCSKEASGYKDAPSVEIEMLSLESTPSCSWYPDGWGQSFTVGDQPDPSVLIENQVGLDAFVAANNLCEGEETVPFDFAEQRIYIVRGASETEAGVSWMVEHEGKVVVGLVFPAYCSGVMPVAVPYRVPLVLPASVMPIVEESCGLPADPICGMLP